MQRIKRFIIRNLSVIVLLLLSFWAIRPLFAFGFFPIHDDTQVARVYEMSKALADGQFPVRWVADLGYGFGYPIFNFYAPLGYYLGGFFGLVGFNALVATKLMFAVGILLAGVSMYFLAREFWGELGGVVSGLFYVYSPYHALDVYVRGAVGEFWAMSLLPLVFLAVYKSFGLLPSTSQEDDTSVASLVHESEPANVVDSGLQAWSLRFCHLGGVFRLFSKWTVFGSLSLAAVILSHNLTAIMLAPILIVILLYCYIVSKNKRLLITHYSLLITSALAFSAFYWLPALAEMKFTKVFGQLGGGADFRDHFVFLDQLWASPWGFGGSASGRLDGMSFMIGKFHLLLALLALILLIPSYRTHDRVSDKKEKRQIWGVGGALVVLTMAIFLTNKVSLPIWEAVRPMAFIQYPWRFLVFASLSTSFMAGAVAWWLKKISPRAAGIASGDARPRWANAFLGRWDFFGGVIVILVLLVFNLKYFQPQFNNGLSNEEYISEEKIKWETSRISDEYLPKDFPAPKGENDIVRQKIVVLSGKVEIENLALKSDRYRFEARVDEGAEILINTAYFPGWRVWMDGEKTDFDISQGRIVLTPPAGEYEFMIRFTNTPIRAMANAISLVAWAGLAGFMLKYRHG